MSAQQCAYGDAACSVAAATWILSVVTLGAFLAAFQAVFWAWKTFSIEVVSRLGESRCQSFSLDNHPAQKEVFLDEDGFVSYRRPPAFDPIASLVLDYFDYHHGFINLGRTALADVKVELYLVDSETGLQSERIPVNVGNVPCDGEIHIAIYTSKYFEKLSITWRNATQATSDDGGRRAKIEFFPDDVSSEGHVFPVYADDPPAPSSPPPPTSGPDTPNPKPATERSTDPNPDA